MQHIRFFRYFPLFVPLSVCLQLCSEHYAFESLQVFSSFFTVSDLGIDSNFLLENLNSTYPICAAFPFLPFLISRAFSQASFYLLIANHVLLVRIRSKISLFNFSSTFWKTEFLQRLKAHHQMHWLKLSDTSTDVPWSVIRTSNCYYFFIHCHMTASY